MKYGIYYWLDLYNHRDGDPRPANGKVLFTFGVFALWCLVALFGLVILLTGRELNAAFLGLAALAAAASGGPDLLKSLFKTRFGGLSSAIQEQERQRPNLRRADVDALAARRQTSSEEHAGTEAVP